MSGAAPTAAGSSRPEGGAIGTVPGSWQQAVLMSRYQLRDYLRSRRFILMIGIVAAICVILLTLLGYYRPPSVIGNATNFYGGVWVGGTEILIIFAGIVFGGDAIAGEFQNKTGYFLMGLPIKRWSVYAGKFIAAYAASLLIIGIYLVALIGAGVYFLGAANAFMGGLFEAFALAALYLGALLGTTFLFSSMFKNSLYGVIVVAIMFLFGFSIIIDLLEALVGITPWFIVTWANSAISYPITGAPHIVRVGNVASAPTYLQGIAVMLGYFFFTTIGGLFLFDREEFT
jgi:ABC-2 type transport system permease protein